MPKQKVVTTRGGRPSPQDALLEFFGGNPPQDPRVALAGARNAQLDEMKHNAENARFGNGYVTGANPSDIAGLEQDINEDPYTGLAAKKSLADREKTMADEQAYMTPGATAVRASQQKDKLAQLLAVPEAQGHNALALEREKNAGALKIQGNQQDFSREIMSSGGNEEGGHGFTPSVNPNGGVSFKGIAPHKPTTEEQRALDTMGSLSALGPEMLQRYEAQYPGIEKDPTKYGGPMEMAKSFFGAGAYKMGYMGDESADQMKQLTGYLEAVLPRMLSSGRINKEQYLDLKLHVPQLGLSAGANYTRAKYVLDSILPHVRSAIGSPMEHGSGGGDPYSDPNYQPR